MDIVQRIRNDVFIREQKVPSDREYDEFENLSVYYLAFLNDRPAGCIRYRKVGSKVKLERLAVLKEMRGRGIGKALMKYAERDALEDRTTEFILNSQLYAMGFYEKCGYRARGGIFLDAGIEHREMHKPAEIARSDSGNEPGKS